MNYPSINEYIEAIRFAEDNFDQLKHLRPVLDEDGEPVMTSGNFAVVFKMKDEQTRKLHAVKCFLREQEGRAEAYRMIAEELEYVSSTFLTPIKYLDKELFVDTNAGDDKEFPVLLMDWVEGDTLDKYIRKHLDDQYELSLLAYQFSRLAMWLMPQPFAHGDLKPDNILVKSDGTLVLVDYDGMYVPAMKGQKARELGSPDFRHPSRTETDFDEHIDDFSLASILLSLKAISLQPSFLKKYGAPDRLLFSANDYRNISGSEALDAVKPLMQDAELASLYSLFILAASQNNLSQVSFRLFNLNRPKEPKQTDADLDAWAAAIEENMPHNEDNCWPLLTFARQHGKMQVGEFVNKETGELFKSCIFTKADGTRTFVAFSTKMGELTPKEIVAMKEELIVEQDEDGNYSLCRNNYRESVNLDNEEYKRNIETRLISKETIIDRNLQIKSPNGKFGIIDVEETYMEGSSWRLKYGYYNIREDNQYNISDIHSIEYNKDKDLLKISFTQVLENDYDAIWFSRQNEKVHMEFYRDHIYVKGFNSRYNKASSSLEELFYAFCSLSQLESDNAIVTLNGGAFQVKYIQNYYTEAQMKNMDSLDNIRSVFDEINKENLSTKVTDEDFASAWTDEYGVTYSEDGRSLLSAQDINSIEYTIREGTQIICDHAFDSCTSLRSIEIPNSVKVIGEASFMYCHSLLCVLIPSSVKVIKDCAFSGCTSLKEVSLQEGLTSIGGSAFSHCESLKIIYIPESVSTFGNLINDGCTSWNGDKASEFDCCDSLESIVIPKGARGQYEKLLPDYKEILFEKEEVPSTKVCSNDYKNVWIDDFGVKYSPDRKRLIRSTKGLKEYSVLEGTNIICDVAFSEIIWRCANPNYIGLTTITIPNSVTAIGEGVFSGCQNLVSVYIPIGTKKRFEELLPEYKDKLVEQEMGWIVKSTRPFSSEEILLVARAEVVPSQYGNSVCFFMNTGGQTYIPLSRQSKLTVGDVLDIKTAKLVTLCQKGKADITRVIEQ